MIENTTHQRMEIYAVLQSLQYIKLQKIAGCEIHIYSDSQYVIGINDRIIKFKASNFLTKKQHPIRNEDLVRSLISCLEELNVRFIKVKAHEKISAYDNINREVDKLARLIVRQHSSQKKK